MIEEVERAMSMRRNKLEKALCIDSNNVLRRLRLEDISEATRVGNGENVYLCKDIECRTCVKQIDKALIVFLLHRLCKDEEELVILMSRGISEELINKLIERLHYISRQSGEFVVNVVNEYTVNILLYLSQKLKIWKSEVLAGYRLWNEISSELYDVIQRCDLEELTSKIRLKREEVLCNEISKLLPKTVQQMDVDRELKLDIREWIGICLNLLLHKDVETLDIATFDFKAFEFCLDVCSSFKKNSDVKSSNRCNALHLCKLCDERAFVGLF